MWKFKFLANHKMKSHANSTILLSKHESVGMTFSLYVKIFVKHFQSDVIINTHENFSREKPNFISLTNEKIFLFFSL